MGSSAKRKSKGLFVADLASRVPYRAIYGKGVVAHTGARYYPVYSRCADRYAGFNAYFYTGCDTDGISCDVDCADGNRF